MVEAGRYRSLGRSKPTQSCEWLRHSVAASRYLAAPLNQVLCVHMSINSYLRYFSFKSALENLFGTEAWYALKETNHIPTWRKWAQKSLKAIRLSIHDTVQICDDEWINEIDDLIEDGIGSLNTCKSIDEITADLSATLLKVSLLQIGKIPQRKGSLGKFQLRSGKWRLDQYRTVAYLQTKEQQEEGFKHSQLLRIGRNEQDELLKRWQEVDSEVSYKEWCRIANAEES